MNSENIKFPTLDITNEIINAYIVPIALAVKDSDLVTLFPPREAV